MLNYIRGKMLANWTVRSISKGFNLSREQARMFQREAKNPEHCLQMLKARNELLTPSF